MNSLPERRVQGGGVCATHRNRAGVVDQSRVIWQTDDLAEFVYFEKNFVKELFPRERAGDSNTPRRCCCVPGPPSSCDNGYSIAIGLRGVGQRSHS